MLTIASVNQTSVIMNSRIYPNLFSIRCISVFDMFELYYKMVKPAVVYEIVTVYLF